MININRGLFLNKNVLLGAGSDKLAGLFATDAGKQDHSVAYIVPNGSKVTQESNVFELSSERMQEANNYILRANKNMNKEWPTDNEELNDSLRRDFYLVRWCQRVYSVGTFTSDDSLLKLSDGLAWAAQMYIDRFLYDREPLSNCELYMFDLKSENWFNWNTTWIRTNNVPTPTGVYAVIGHNKLSKVAKNAIDNLWKN